MYNTIIDSLYIFFVILEILLFLYMISKWFRISMKVMEPLAKLVDPVLDPIRFLLRFSIFQVRTYDLSPIIGFIVITYLQNFFFALK